MHLLYISSINMFRNVIKLLRLLEQLNVLNIELHSAKTLDYDFFLQKNYVNDKLFTHGRNTVYFYQSYTLNIP